MRWMGTTQLHRPIKSSDILIYNILCHTVTKTCISHKSVRLKFRWNSPLFISSSPLLTLFLSSTTVLHSTPLSSFGFWAQYWRAPLAMAAAAFCSMGHRHALKNLTELLPDRLTVNGQALSLSLSLHDFLYLRGLLNIWAWYFFSILQLSSFPRSMYSLAWHVSTILYPHIFKKRIQ